MSHNMLHEISNTDDILDVRDIISRFEELNDLDCDEDEMEEYKLLDSLINGLRGNGGDHQWQGDWFPVTLIRESYFEDYARELANDIYGKEIDDAKWPFSCIDWEQAANELRQDYTSIDFDGETYLTR